jgi:Cu-Zn family superoxide dismutase
MKRISVLTISCILLTILAFTNYSPVIAQKKKVIKAKAMIQGAPGSGISGEAMLVQTVPSDPNNYLPTVKITMKITGLPPNTVHGTHFHEKGVCDPPGFTTAGGHFDPGPFSMSNPDANHPFHMGDMPNLVANVSGVAVLKHVSSRITLSPGPLSIFDADGTVILVHQNPDQGITGAAGSGVAGGTRIACGVVELIQSSANEEIDE